jgi:hypothetical protein
VTSFRVRLCHTGFSEIPFQGSKDTTSSVRCVYSKATDLRHGSNRGTFMPLNNMEAVEKFMTPILEAEAKLADERLPLRGRFADQNHSIPKQHIDEAQQDAWSGFPRELPEQGEP